MTWDAVQADIIIPFHGRWDMVIRCLSALEPVSRRTRRVFLVDDGSPPQDRWHISRLVERLSLPVEWLSVPRRGGFVAAINHAWSRSTTSMTLVLNSDTVPPPELLPELAATLSAHPQVAAVAPASDNRLDVYQYRGEGRVPCDEPAGALSYVPYLTAACLAVRRHIIDGPLFDPIFSPGYFEDFDLSCRLRARGWRLAVLESSRIHHAGRATFGLDANLASIIARNSATFAARWSHLPEHAMLWARLGAVDSHGGAAS